MLQSNKTITGILLAILATLIWSGNFIVARGASELIGPVSLAFLRWSCAALLITPLAWGHFKREWPLVKQHPWHFFWAALFGISLFNTLVYVAGHHSPAINLALIGTTSSPVFSFILAAIFLKEKIPLHRVIGLLVCLAGILLLISKASWDQLLHFRFSTGDIWILVAAASFAMYNIFARRKPAGISAPNYLFTTFWMGTLLLLPFFIVENRNGLTWQWTPDMAGIILYLGAGTSVAAFYCWNAAIQALGAARTSIFGNLIPLFSSVEAVIILGEKIQPYHWWGMLIITLGLLMANVQWKKLLDTFSTAKTVKP